MSIEDAISNAQRGIFPVATDTPVTDKAIVIFASDLPIQEKWDQLMALEVELDEANEDDCYRYGCILEGMYASAQSPEDLAYLMKDRR